MKVITPGALARPTGSKYLGVLVAAKYARSLNEFRRGELMEEPAPGAPLREKLTTTALREVASGALDYDLIQKRRAED
jgi:DNA-directed RNA polymerase omega subunit